MLGTNCHDNVFGPISRYDLRKASVQHIFVQSVVNCRIISKGLAVVLGL
jgi:hypothetical protein